MRYEIDGNAVLVWSKRDKFLVSEAIVHVAEAVRGNLRVDPVGRPGTRSSGFRVSVTYRGNSRRKKNKVCEMLREALVLEFGEPSADDGSRSPPLLPK